MNREDPSEDVLFTENPGVNSDWLVAVCPSFDPEDVVGKLNAGDLETAGGEANNEAAG